MKARLPNKQRNATDYSPLVQQNWSFLSKETLRVPDKAGENFQVMKSIHDMEAVSMDERILDVYEHNLVQMINSKVGDDESASGRLSPSAIPEEFLISLDDVKELAISLSTIRKHAKEKRLNDLKSSPTSDAKSPAGFLPKVARTDEHVIRTSTPFHTETADDLSIHIAGEHEHDHDEHEARDVHGEAFSEIDRVLLNFRTDTRRISEMRDSFNSNPTYVEAAAHGDDKIAKALSKSRAKVSKALADSMRQKLTDTHEIVEKTAIARKFRSYAMENGMRLPGCVSSLPPLPSPTAAVARDRDRERADSFVESAPAALPLPGAKLKRAADGSSGSITSTVVPSAPNSARSSHVSPKPSPPVAVKKKVTVAHPTHATR